MPIHAIDSTGKIYKDPDTVKKVYLTEGTLFLRKKLEAPGPEERKKRAIPIPQTQKRKEKLMLKRRNKITNQETPSPNGGTKCTIAQPKISRTSHGKIL